jgi:hypothetical protein
MFEVRRTSKYIVLHYEIEEVCIEIFVAKTNKMEWEFNCLRPETLLKAIHYGERKK